MNPSLGALCYRPDCASFVPGCHPMDLHSGFVREHDHSDLSCWT